jgi:hypothetical protein
MGGFLLLGLLGLNAPLFCLLGWLMFDDLDEFEDGLMLETDWWTSAKAIGLVIACVAIVAAEDLLIRRQFRN